jgi:purine-nucleoside phosphorylase
VVSATRYEQLGEHLRQRFGSTPRPRAVVIAGSGLGGFARWVQSLRAVSYDDLPGVGASTVAGHAGQLILGLSPATEPGRPDVPVLILAGRRHIYEGIPAEDSVLLLQATLLAFRPSAAIISNAAGGLNPLFDVGDLMLISDHLNAMARNPLIGPNPDHLGPRFPDLSHVYDPNLRALARQAAQEVGVVLREGVYIGGLGPSYETRAEVAMLRHVFRGDTVGMSTVLEAIACSHLGIPTLGISFVSNTLTVPAVTTHEEVMENSRKVEDRFARLVGRILEKLPEPAAHGA